MRVKKKWTIGIVNFSTLEFIEYQLKCILQLNNDTTLYDIIIVDNSLTSEIDQLKEISKECDNIFIIRNDQKLTPWLRGSGHHGQGIDLIVQHCQSDYLLVTDPDFFWVSNEYLLMLEGLFLQGYECIGAPYRHENEVGEIGPTDFPAAFGAAYKVSQVKLVSFLPDVDKESYESSDGVCWIRRPGADVGWQARELLKNKNYYSFVQKPALELAVLGSYSYEIAPYKYFLQDNLLEPIGYHLFRGSFGNDLLSFSKHGILLKNDSLSTTRKRFGFYFYLISLVSTKKTFFNRFFLSSYLFYFKYFRDLTWIDISLHAGFYSPTIKVFGFIHRFFYVSTHPVEFMRKLINRYGAKCAKSNN